MTKRERWPSGPMPSNKRGPNMCSELESHCENMKEKTVNNRLTKLLEYNILCNVKQGMYPTPGQLIVSTRFGRPSRNHTFTSDAHFDHIVLPLLNRAI